MSGIILILELSSILNIVIYLEGDRVKIKGNKELRLRIWYCLSIFFVEIKLKFFKLLIILNLFLYFVNK